MRIHTHVLKGKERKGTERNKKKWEIRAFILRIDSKHDVCDNAYQATKRTNERTEWIWYRLKSLCQTHGETLSHTHILMMGFKRHQMRIHCEYINNNRVCANYAWDEVKYKKGNAHHACRNQRKRKGNRTHIGIVCMCGVADRIPSCCVCHVKW